MSEWRDLVTASLIGTERAGVPAPAVPGLPVRADAVPDDPATLLLDRAALLAGYAAALAADPWLDTWPAVVEIIPARAPAPAVCDADGGVGGHTGAGGSLPLHPGAGDCWPLFALSGGRPVTLAGEWTPRGLWPLTAWDETGRAVPL